MKRWLKRIPAIVVAIVVVGLVVYAFLPKAVGVDLASIERGPLQVTVDEDGKTRIKERYVVSSPLGGRLMRISLHEGDRVEAGQTLLATIEPTDPALLDPRERAEAEARVRSREAALKQANANLEQAHAGLDLAESEFGRTKKLAEKQAVSQQELDSAESLYRTRSEEYRAARFAEEMAQFELELAKAALLRTQPDSDGPADSQAFEIRAPITGSVLRVFQESAKVVDAGAQLLEVGDPTDIEVEVDVLSTDAVKIRPGARVLFEHWGGDWTLEGKVRLVEPAAFTKISALGVEEQRVWVRIDFVDPPERRETLGDAYRVEAKIVTWESEGVLKAPTSALFRAKEKWAVFHVVDGHAKLQTVEIGHRNSLSAEVLAGLREGDQVVVYPSDNVKDGAAVAPR